mmetsp:Transcript_31728/g.53033  ORF Transcript_31728/g.53033 Transcript_31728/m.53033 type:complete len:409 (-) Transcript_31728:185-1411(-)
MACRIQSDTGGDNDDDSDNEKHDDYNNNEREGLIATAVVIKYLNHYWNNRCDHEHNLREFFPSWRDKPTGATDKATRPVTTMFFDTNLLVPNLLVELAKSCSMESENHASVTTMKMASKKHSVGVYSSLLNMRSDWFRTILGADMIESSTNRITLPDTDATNFQLLLLFLYGDALLFTSMKDVIGVLELANRLDLRILVTKCEGILIRLVSTANACELLEFADSLNLGLLRTACIAELLRNVQALPYLLSDEIVIHGSVANGSSGRSDNNNDISRGPISASRSNTRDLSFTSAMDNVAAAVQEFHDTNISSTITAGTTSTNPVLDVSIPPLIQQLINETTSSSANLTSTSNYCSHNTIATEALVPSAMDLLHSFSELSPELRKQVRHHCLHMAPVYKGNIPVNLQHGR